MQTITYNLEAGEKDFYGVLSALTDDVADEFKRGFSFINQFRAFVSANHLEPLRTNEEYCLELSTIGVYWLNYHEVACKVPDAVTTACTRLVSLRKQHRQFKPVIDLFRGQLATTFLSPAQSVQTNADGKPKPRPVDGLPNRFNSPKPPGLSNSGLNKLKLWMTATGDFPEEVKRFSLWQQYFETLSHADQTRFFSEVVQFAKWFIVMAYVALKPYTSAVDKFISQTSKRYKGREDIVLCSRKESDYHLIMVGSELLNRVFRPKFEKTKTKVVLLPGCMRDQQQSRCQAKLVGEDYICVRCNHHCQVGKIAKLGAEHPKYKVRVIPHATDFTAQLKKWKNQTDVGIIASACILHLYTGGYEMKNLNIPAQCIFLNYCGCKNHWHAKGIPTQIDMNRLIQLL